MKPISRTTLMNYLLVACLIAALGMFTACSSQENASTSKGSSSQTEEASTQTITDDAGREVTFPSPQRLEKIYYTSPIAQIFCFTLAPELAGGTTMEFTDAELAYLPEESARLPYLGSLSMNKELNPEAIMAENIQVIFSITNTPPKDSDISTADGLQSQTGIPVVVLDGTLDKTADTYHRLGTLLNKEQEAEKLASYCEKALKEVKTAVAQIPESERVSLYYAEGSEGLQTEPESSPHAATFKFANAKNVAAVDVIPGSGMSPVSLEQVLAWNPEVIIAWDKTVRGGADELIRTNPNWSSIKAVQDGKVYTMPNIPFSWCDRPPAVNRILGIQWVAHTLYPQAYKVDMVKVTQEFYETFYHRELTDAQAKEILGNSYSE